MRAVPQGGRCLMPPASDFETCIKRIASKGGITGAEARRVLDEIYERGSKMEAAGTKRPYEAAAAEMVARATEAAKRDRLDALRNATIRSDIMAKVEKNGGLRNA